MLIDCHLFGKVNVDVSKREGWRTGFFFDILLTIQRLIDGLIENSHFAPGTRIGDNIEHLRLPIAEAGLKVSYN